MTRVIAGITTSVDGYVAGPDDGPGKGLGEDGEKLHYWVFGGLWTYDAPPEGEATGDDDVVEFTRQVRRRATRERQLPVPGDARQFLARDHWANLRWRRLRHAQ